MDKPGKKKTKKSEINSSEKESEEENNVVNSTRIEETQGNGIQQTMDIKGKEKFKKKKKKNTAGLSSERIYEGREGTKEEDIQEKPQKKKRSIEVIEEKPEKMKCLEEDKIEEKGIEAGEFAAKASPKKKNKGIEEIKEKPEKSRSIEEEETVEKPSQKKKYKSFEVEDIAEKSQKEKGIEAGEIEEGSAQAEVIAEKPQKKKKKKSIEVEELEETPSKNESIEEEGIIEKSKKKKNKSTEGEEIDESPPKNSSIQGEEIERTSIEADEEIVEKPKKKKKNKSIEAKENEEKPENNKGTEEDEIEHRSIEVEAVIEKTKRKKSTEEEENTEEPEINKCIEEKPKKIKKKQRCVREGEECDDMEGEEKRRTKRKHKGIIGEVHNNSLVRGSPSDSPLHKKQKRVTFSDQVQVFSAGDKKEQDIRVDTSKVTPFVQNVGKDKLVWGKRFQREEDEAIKDAIDRYIKEHGLDKEDGLHKILNCGKFPEVRNCWREIGARLHWRPLQSVYIRAHILYERASIRGWTEDELNLLKRLQATHGNKWKKISMVLGKSRYHVKDAWRRIKRGVMNKGHWSQDEYQKLFDLVNYNLLVKESLKEEKTSNRVLRDNISWEAIADEMATRDHVFCCKKWYYNLASSMVQTGEWENGDDHSLLERLLETNASDEEEVDWNDLLEQRSGETCLKRWKQMVKHLGEYRSIPFLEQLDLLVKRYAPHLIE
eukprot:Gb_06266 [translate_table: standard]